MTDSYFQDEAAGRRSGAAGAYSRLSDQPEIDAGGGVKLRVVVGEQLLLSHVTIAPLGEAPVHTHDEEQLGLIVSGTAQMDLDGQRRELVVGDTYHAPPGVPHGLVAGSDGCVIVDLFSPPRRALVALLEAARSASEGATPKTPTP